MIVTNERGRVTPIRISYMHPEGAIAGLRWPHEGAPPLLFCHASSFCASAYKQMLGRLAHEFDIFALDFRGHGKTCLPADPGRLPSFHPYVCDIQYFLDTEYQPNWFLAGHSLGASVVTLASRGRRDIAGLALIEPVALPPIVSRLAKTPLWAALGRFHPFVRRAEARRLLFSSREAVRAAYREKAVFRNFAPGVLDDYLEDGLCEDDAGVRLACSPAWEVATYRAQANDFWPAIKARPAPVRVLAADHPSSTVSRGAPARFAQAGCDLVSTAEISHLAPFERPDLCAEFIAGMRKSPKNAAAGE